MNIAGNAFCVRERSAANGAQTRRWHFLSAARRFSEDGGGEGVEK